MPDAAPETGNPADQTPEPTPAPAKDSTPATPDPKATEPIKLPDDHPLVKAYADTKAKLKKREDADLSETERLTNDLASQTSRGDKAEARVALLEAAMEHGLSKDDLALLGDGSPEDIAARAKGLAERLQGSRKGGGRAPREGDNPKAGTDDERTAVRELFRAG